jgi:hypothetical protein
MRSLRGMLYRVGGLFRRNELEAGMKAEMQAHLDGLTERNLTAGISPEEARHAAQREFGCPRAARRRSIQWSRYARNRRKPIVRRNPSRFRNYP